MHVLSEQDAQLDQRHLHEVPDVMRKDLVRGGKYGLGIGVALAVLVLALGYFAGWSESAAGWITRRAAGAGFAIDPGAVRVPAEEWVRIPRERGRPVVFSALTMRGALTVRDPPRFVAAIAHGFGAAKAFGCGLMLIQRG